MTGLGLHSKTCGASTEKSVFRGVCLSEQHHPRVDNFENNLQRITTNIPSFIKELEGIRGALYPRHGEIIVCNIPSC